MTFFNRCGITGVDGKLETHTLGTQQQDKPLSCPVLIAFFRLAIGKSLKLFTDNGQWTKNKKRIAK
jgi:hypothetical protein